MDSSILKKTVNSFSVLKSNQNDTNIMQEESLQSIVQKYIQKDQDKSNDSIKATSYD